MRKISEVLYYRNTKPKTVGSRQDLERAFI